MQKIAPDNAYYKQIEGNNQILSKPKHVNTINEEGKTFPTQEFLRFQTKFTNKHQFNLLKDKKGSSKKSSFR